MRSMIHAARAGITTKIVKARMSISGRIGGFLETTSNTSNTGTAARLIATKTAAAMRHGRG